MWRRATSVAPSWAASTAERVVGSLKAHRTDTDLGGLKVASTPATCSPVEPRETTISSVRGSALPHAKQISAAHAADQAQLLGVQPMPAARVLAWAAALAQVIVAASVLAARARQVVRVARPVNPCDLVECHHPQDQYPPKARIGYKGPSFLRKKRTADYTHRRCCDGFRRGWSCERSFLGRSTQGPTVVRRSTSARFRRKMKLSSSLTAVLTILVFVLPVVMLLASAATWLADLLSRYFTGETASQPERLSTYRRHVRFAITLVCVAGVYAALLVPVRDQTNLSAYDSLFRHHIFDMLVLAGLVRSVARFQSRLNVERKVVLYALVGALGVAVAMYTNDEPAVRILDTSQYAAMAGATFALFSHVIRPRAVASAMANHIVELHGYVVRSSVATWEYRRVRRCIKRYRAEALAELGFVALRLLAKRDTRSNQLLFVGAFDELDECFKNEVERLDCGVPTARNLGSNPIILYSLHPQLDRCCPSCGVREPTTSRRCDPCGTALRRNLPSPYGRLAVAKERRNIMRAASTSCRRRTQIAGVLACIGAVFLAVGGVLPWFLHGARASDILTAALAGKTAMFWYGGLSIATVWWAWSLVDRPWLRPRPLLYAWFFVIACSANALVMADLLLMRTVDPFRSFSMALSTTAAWTGASLLTVAAVLDSTIPRLRKRALSAHEPTEADAATSGANTSHHLSKVARLYRLAARVVDPAEIERGLRGKEPLIIADATPRAVRREQGERRPGNLSLQTPGELAEGGAPPAKHEENGDTPRPKARTRSNRERPQMAKA